MTSREKLKDAYEKLDCFNNPVLKDISNQLKESYKGIFGQGIEEVIKDVATENNATVTDIKSDKRDERLVYCRYLIANEAYGDYSYTEIADALNRNHATIMHLINSYIPPQKYT